MSSTDNRIVRMTFDNDKFEKGVAQTLDSLGKLKKGLDLDGATKGLTSLNSAAKGFSLRGIGSGVETIAQRFTNLGIVGTTALMNITNSAVNAGKRILNALTVQPVTTGFNEYELKMGAIQTIMASTGEELGTVNDYLADLNEYSDKTIYSFADMTQNIGKFTNAGVELEDAVNAIKGVSNAAAVAGANSEEASRAMYNFSQALSAGYVKLIDWKSIENANMATVEFKQQLIDTALATGAVTDAGDGMYRTLDGNLFNATKNFNEVLTDQWMTTEVLTETLANYADESTEIGKKAYAAAQDIKTFTQLYDTLKEAAQSGWASSWELVVGDFEEAKAMLGSVSEAIGGFIGASAESRNAVLRDWKALGGRAVMIKAISIAFNNLVDTVKPIKEAFRELFPKTTGSQLYGITVGLRRLATNFKIGSETAKNIKTTFKGLFSVVRLIADAFGYLIDTITPGAKSVKSVSDSFWEITASIGQALINLTDMLRNSEELKNKFDGIVETIGGLKEKLFGFFKGFDFGFDDSHLTKQELRMKMLHGEVNRYSTALEKAGYVIKTGFATGLANANENLEKMLNFVSMVKDKLANFGASIKEALNPLGDQVKGAFSDVTVADFIGTGLIAGIAAVVWKTMKSAGGLLDGVMDILTQTREALEAYQNNLNAGTLQKIAIAIGILALSLIALTFVDPDKLVPGLLGITALLAEVMITMKAMEHMNLKGLIGGTTAILIMSGAILIMARALAALSDIKDVNAITPALVAMGAMLGALVIAIGKISKMDIRGGRFVTTALGILIFAMAVGKLADAMKVLSTMSKDELKKGLLALGAILVEVSLFVRTYNSKGMKSNVATILAISASLLALYFAVKLFGNMDVGVLQQGLLTIGALLAMLAISMRVIGNVKIKGVALSLLAIAGAFVILQKPIAMFGAMDQESLSKGMMAFATILGGLTLAIFALGSMKGSSLKLTALAGLLVSFAAAVYIIGQAVASLGAIGWDELGVGLVGVLVPLGALVALSAVASPIKMLALSGALVAMAGAMFVMAMATKMLSEISMANLGKALFGLIAPIAGLGIAAALLAPVIPAMFALATAVGLLGLGLFLAGTGLVAFGVGLTALAALTAVQAAAIIGALDVLAKGLISVVLGAITVFLDSLATFIPAVGRLVESILLTVLGIIKRVTPALVETVLAVTEAILTGLTEHIPEIAAKGVDLVVALANALIEAAPRLIQAGVDMILAFTNGLATKIEENDESLVEAVNNLILALIRLAITALEGAVSLFKDAGELLMDSGLWEGINEKSQEVIDAITAIPEQALELLGELVSDFFDIGAGLVAGIIEGIKAGYKALKEAGKNMGGHTLEGIIDETDTNSPSKETEKLGIFAVDGYVKGIEQHAKNAKRAAEKMGEETINALSNTMKRLVDMISENSEFQPTLRPVVDLTEVKRQLDRTFEMQQGLDIQGTAYKAAGINPRSVYSNVSDQGTHNTTTVTHTGRIRVEGVSDEGQLVAVKDIIIKEIERGDRRLPNRASIIPI